jgi:hypothetical protein
MPPLPDDKQELEERQEYTCPVMRTLFAGNPISITRSSPVTHRHPHDFLLERQRLKTADLRTVTSSQGAQAKINIEPKKCTRAFKPWSVTCENSIP